MDDERVIPSVQYLDITSPLDVDPSPIITPSMGVSDLGFGGSVVSTVDIISTFTVMDLVQLFVIYAFIVASALSALFIFVGVISFILSGGNDEKIKQAVNTIRYAIVGLIVTILSFTFVTIVGRIFGLNFLDYLSYGQIKSSINLLIQGETQPKTQRFTLPRR